MQLGKSSYRLTANTIRRREYRTINLQPFLEYNFEFKTSCADKPLSAEIGRATLGEFSGYARFSENKLIMLIKATVTVD